MSWQQKVIQYDRNGPGILGYYLDTVALLASLCPLVPEVLGDDGRWKRSDDQVLNVLAAGYRTPRFEQDELVSSHVRAREGVGEAWIIYSRDIGWNIATVPNVVPAAGHDGAVQWTDLFGITRKTPGDHVYKSWVPDPYQPWLPKSAVQRALPNLKRIHSAVRSQIGAANSRLIMNGLLAFDDGDDTGSSSRPLLPQSHPDGQERAIPDGIDEIIADYMDAGQKAYMDEDSVAAFIPFPYLGKKAEYIEVGRGIDKMAMEMETKGLEGFARDVNFPAQLLTTGPGNANHWNEWILQEIQHKMGLAPKLNPVCDDITTIYFRPVVKQVAGMVGAWSVDSNRVRLRPDYSFLTSKPDKAGQAIEAYRTGAIERKELVETLGFEHMMELPKGLSEYEHWQIVAGRPAAPYVDVDGEDRVIAIPANPETGDMSGLPVLNEDGTPADVPDAATQGDVDNPGQAAVEAPPAPPAEIAAIAEPFDVLRTADAVDDAWADGIEAKLAALAAIDQALAAQLEAVATAAATAAMVEVAKAVIRAYPAKDDRRAVLRDLPPEEVWAAADPEIRATIDVESVASDALGPYRAQIDAAFAQAEEQIQDEHDTPTVELLVAAGVAALLVGITAAVVRWATTPAGFTRDAVARTGKARILRVPQSVIRAAMIAAGGGRVGLDDQLVQGAAGTPTPNRGGAWAGGPGMATGHNSIENLVAPPPGWRYRLRWVHGLYRTPMEPFQPHVDLHRQMFDQLGDVPGGYFPGDHPWCSCGMVPTLVRVEAP